MENKKSKIAHISEPTASKNPGTSYVFVKLETGERAAYFFRGNLELKTGQEIEYTITGEPGRLKLNIASDRPKWSGGNNYQPKTNNRLEALKLTIEMYVAGKCPKDKIRETTKYLEGILSE